ncbi:D,D-dipeptide ABC transporter permease, partial [Candidatus Bipolaricaulota bacterium]|nr:D,D-dipeptide ABC transporter permease [Candidatus Bipolaricaulota bacterium]
MSKRLPRTVRLVLKNRLTTTGLSVVFLLILVALLAPWIVPFPHDTVETHIKDRFLSPSSQHFFGTDELGRDVFSRVL